MQIKRLRIDNYRCFLDFDIAFTTISGGGATILIGENGTGKSTMMECLLNILMSFDSPAIEKQIDYNYTLDYEYAQKLVSVVKVGHDYRIAINDFLVEGSYKKIRPVVQKRSPFPQRVIAFYSGGNNKLAPNIGRINARYSSLCRKTLRNFLRAMSDDSEQFLPTFSKKKYNYCEEGFVPIYLVSILCGQESFEKSYLSTACDFGAVLYVDMVINVDKVEKIFGRGRFEGDAPTRLYYLTDFIDHRFTDVLRRGFIYSAAGKAYFSIKGIDALDVDSIAILEFFEKLYTLFDAKLEVTVFYGKSTAKCSEMSEGQRQLIKILGMLGICKTEDCLVLMDEPDAYMNPKWKYEIKETMDNSLKEAINTQAIIATHDPLVINGVAKEFIRIFTRTEVQILDDVCCLTKVITPTEDTEGMGIDGLLQSEYYGLQTSYDKASHQKFLRRQELYAKLIHDEATENEKEELRAITKELGMLPLSYNSIDFLYDDFLNVYKNTDLYRKEYLSYDEVIKRREKIQDIIEKLYERKT